MMSTNTRKLVTREHVHDPRRAKSRAHDHQAWILGGHCADDLGSAPERVIQVHCALELIKLRFMVTIEPTAKPCQYWFGLREQSGLDGIIRLRFPSKTAA